MLNPEISLQLFSYRISVTTTLSSRVANLRPAWNDTTQDFDAGFYKVRYFCLIT